MAAISVDLWSRIQMFGSEPDPRFSLLAFNLPTAPAPTMALLPPFDVMSNYANARQKKWSFRIFSYFGNSLVGTWTRAGRNVVCTGTDVLTFDSKGYRQFWNFTTLPTITAATAGWISRTKVVGVNGDFALDEVQVSGSSMASGQFYEQPICVITATSNNWLTLFLMEP